MNKHKLLEGYIYDESLSDLQELVKEINETDSSEPVKDKILRIWFKEQNPPKRKKVLYNKGFTIKNFILCEFIYKKRKKYLRLGYDFYK